MYILLSAKHCNYIRDMILLCLLCTALVTKISQLAGWSVNSLFTQLPEDSEQQYSGKIY